MRLKIFLPLLAFSLLYAGAPRAETFMEALKGLGQAANRANSAVLKEYSKDTKETPDDSIRQFREAEKVRAQRMAAATGVSEEIIARERFEGQTWQQIADKYNVNLNEVLPDLP